MGLVLLLIAGIAVIAVNTADPQKAEAVAKHPNLRGAAANPFFVYVKADEWITAIGAPYSGAGGGSGIQRYVTPDGTSVDVPGNSFTTQATEDGIYQLHYDVAYPHGTWEIDVTSQENGAGTEHTGRVWAERYHMSDNGTFGNNDHEFWVIDDSGYRYKLDLYGYTGINSTISANALGIAQGADCVPIYRSVEGKGLSVPSGYQIDCGQPFRLFFEEPAADLPASAQINGVERWIAPAALRIDDLTSGTIDFTPGTDPGVPGAGTFATTVDPRFQGAYYIEIDADGDGNFDGPNDRRVHAAAEGGGNYSHTFNGLDNEGDPFPACTPMNARMTFESVGEIHLVQVDVEGRDGIGFQKLNGLDAGTDQERIVYWDDTNLTPVGEGTNGVPVNGINPPFGPDGTSGHVSGPGVHGWDYTLESWGNDRLIDDWTHTPLQETHSEIMNFTTYCPQPEMDLEKLSNFTADSRPGDVITYEVTATNIGDGDFTADNPAIVYDDLSEVLDDADFDVTGASANKPGDIDYIDNALEWQGALAVGDSVTLTYEVTLKPGGDGVVTNVAWQPEDPTDRTAPDCAADDPTCDATTGNLPRLTVDKESSTAEFAGPGDTVTYSVTVTNEGPGEFTAVAPATMTDNLSDVLESAELVSAPSADVGTVSLNPETDVLAWSGPLAVGETTIITYEARYTATYANGQDTLLENTACVPENLLLPGADVCASVEVVGPILSQWKSVTSNDDPVAGGSAVNYTLHFENSGEAPSEVNAVDHLEFVLDDASLQFTADPESALTVTPDGEKLLITGTVPPGDTATISYSVIPGADGDRTDSVLSNFLTPEGEEPPDDGVCVPTDEERPDCTTTLVAASMLLEKRGQGPTSEIPLTGAEFELAPKGGAAIPVTDESSAGVFLVEGLLPGDYTLTETKAPSGYTLLADSIGFQVLPSGALSADETDTVRIESDGEGTWRLIINDVSAFELPMSGGLGNLPWILGGVLLAGAALTTSLVRARREQNTSAIPA